MQIKIGVQDLAKARSFYQAAFSLEESLIRHTDDADFAGYQFGRMREVGQLGTSRRRMGAARQRQSDRPLPGQGFRSGYHRKDDVVGHGFPVTDLRFRRVPLTTRERRCAGAGAAAWRADMRTFDRLRLRHAI